MALIPYIPDPQRYDDGFLVQLYMDRTARYSGSGTQSDLGFSPQILKDIFGSIGEFVDPVLQRAVPHGRAAFVAARPHLAELASDKMRQSASRISQAIYKKLIQQSKGVRKRKWRSKVRRIPPKNVPDYV